MRKVALRAVLFGLVVAAALLAAFSPLRVGAKDAPRPPADATIGEATTCVHEPYPHATCTIYDPATGTTRTTVLP